MGTSPTYQHVRDMTAEQLSGAGIARPLKALSDTQKFKWNGTAGSEVQQFFDHFSSLEQKTTVDDHRILSGSTIVQMRLSDVRQRYKQPDANLLALQVPCPLPEAAIVPRALQAADYGLLRDLKASAVSSTNMWDNLTTFAMLMGDMGCVAVMVPYGFGMWVTPQDDDMLVIAAKKMSGQQLVEWMKDPEGRNFGIGDMATSATVKRGVTVYIPPGNIYTIMGNFVLAGYVLQYEDLAAWSTVLALQLEHPKSTVVDISVHAARFLRDAASVVDRAEAHGEVEKFGGPEKVAEFRRNHKVCEGMLSR